MIYPGTVDRFLSSLWKILYRVSCGVFFNLIVNFDIFQFVLKSSRLYKEYFKIQNSERRKVKNKRDHKNY